ncbi:MAG: DNA photolyase family protein [Acidimicrobiia bacterium]|nr:DNA photolyase family protein [Acidimicrobiia bacterium]
MTDSAVVWFRRDLRIGENPAWGNATKDADSVLPLFVVDPRLMAAAGDHRRNQLVAHLAALDEDLQSEGGRLHVAVGDPVDVVPAVSGSANVYWNDDYTPYARRRDGAVAAKLGDRVHRFHGNVVHPPGTLLTGSGAPYKVFTPFSKRWFSEPVRHAPEPGPAAVSVDPGIGVPDGDEPLMAGGERAALDRLEAFAAVVGDYPTTRDRPDLDATSRLSADLKFGTLSPLQVMDRIGTETDGARAFVRQLCWRDFYAAVIDAFPHTAQRAMRPEYDGIEWRNDDDDFSAWCAGRTGYPIVDAGMRQLAGEGWVHNRVRMIVASFLVKDLLIDWRWGERFFRRWLVDGDVAQNVGNWQWVAGTGVDAAPYFRVFNPVTQSKKFDPSGEYIRRWVPELAELGNAHIHAPWESGPLELAAAGITLDDTYPLPIVDHAEARERCLETYQRARGRAGT